MIDFIATRMMALCFGEVLIDMFFVCIRFQAAKWEETIAEYDGGEEVHAVSSSWADRCSSPSPTSDLEFPEE